MGAWGTGIFEDDTAYDVLASLMLADPMEQMEEWFANVKDTDYLEYTDAQCVLLSAAVIDAALNGTVYPCDDEETLAAVVAVVKGAKPKRMAGIATMLLERILGDSSELRELWEENEELYPMWRRGIEDLEARLDAISA